MKTDSSRMPVSFRPSRELVPGWWEDEFHRRQGKLRTRIPVTLRRLGQAATQQQIRQYLAPWSTTEIMYGLDILVRAGVLAAERRVERAGGPQSGLTERVYYSLVEVDTEV